jgi:DNA processing protein
MEAVIRALSRQDAEYPKLLAAISDAPDTLFVRGTLPESATPCVAIVGTRKATTEGKRLACGLARELASRGVVIVSGLALGIDAAAHDGALEAKGRTLAVLANGLDAVYPASNEHLASRIIAMGGALISEYPAGTPALPHQFLARNRIVSGLSLGIIVVEAPIHSGALATARHAANQGRELFVTPGPTGHPNFAGSHMLLRNGARIVTSADDVLEDLGLETACAPDAPEREGEATQEFTETERAIIDHLRGTQKPCTLDAVVEATGLPPEVVSRDLTLLSLEGAVEERAGMFMIKHIRS